jgi:acetyl esterase
MSGVKLDKDSQYFLDVFNQRANKELGNTKLSQLQVDQARKKIAKLLAPDEDTNRIKLPDCDVKIKKTSITYSIHDRSFKIPVRIYSPQNNKEKLPIMMYFHGGGFALGDNTLIDFGCQYLAENTPCHVIAVDYRKSPEYKFPTAHYDAYFTTLYVAEHFNEFNGNGILAVGGDSAGGNLAASVCHMARASRAFDISFQLLLYPWVDLNNNSESDKRLSHGYYLEVETLNWMTNLYVSTADDIHNPLASPLLRSDFSELPPSLIIIGTADPIHDDAKEYHEKLLKAGNNSTFKSLDGILHDFCALPTFFHAVQDTFKLAKEHFRKYV